MVRLPSEEQISCHLAISLSHCCPSHSRMLLPIYDDDMPNVPSHMLQMTEPWNVMSKPFDTDSLKIQHIIFIICCTFGPEKSSTCLQCIMHVTSVVPWLLPSLRAWTSRPCTCSPNLRRLLITKNYATGIYIHEVSHFIPQYFDTVPLAPYWVYWH